MLAHIDAVATVPFAFTSEITRLFQHPQGLSLAISLSGAKRISQRLSGPTCPAHLQQRVSEYANNQDLSEVRRQKLACENAELTPAMFQMPSGFLLLYWECRDSARLSKFWPHANDSMARSIYIRDEKKHDGKSDRQN